MILYASNGRQYCVIPCVENLRSRSFGSLFIQLMIVESACTAQLSRHFTCHIVSLRIVRQSDRSWRGTCTISRNNVFPLGRISCPLYQIIGDDNGSF